MTVYHNRPPAFAMFVMRPNHRMPWSCYHFRLQTDCVQFLGQPIGTLSHLAGVRSVSGNTRESQKRKIFVEMTLAHGRTLNQVCSLRLSNQCDVPLAPDLIQQTTVTSRSRKISLHDSAGKASRIRNTDGEILCRSECVAAASH